MISTLVFINLQELQKISLKGLSTSVDSFYEGFLYLLHMNLGDTLALKLDSSDASRYLNFSLNEELYAIPLMRVKEVIGNLTTTPIPNAPAHFKGLINLRGQVIPVLDLRLKLKLPKAAVAGAETTIIILDLDSHQVGVIVDSVESVLNFPESEIERSGSFDSMMGGHFLEGVAKKDKDLVLLLDIHKTFNGPDAQIVKNTAAKAG